MESGLEKHKQSFCVSVVMAVFMAVNLFCQQKEDLLLPLRSLSLPVYYVLYNNGKLDLVPTYPVLDCVSLYHCKLNIFFFVVELLIG